MGLQCFVQKNHITDDMNNITLIELFLDISARYIDPV